MKNTPNAPFTCKYTPQIPELLLNLNCSIAISTYQAGKLVLISPKDENSLVQLPRHFEKLMGIAEDKKKDKLALACKDQVIVFSNLREGWKKAVALHCPSASIRHTLLPCFAMVAAR